MFNHDKKHLYTWIEKYRPSVLDDYIGDAAIRTKFAQFITEQRLPHLLFHGPAGTGKTTAAKILIRNIECESLLINASEENNIETVRTKIIGFVSSICLDNIKIVLLDECLDENTLVYVVRSNEELCLPIKELNPATDFVLSWNELTDDVELKAFELLDKHHQETMTIEFDNGESVTCTLDHKWYVEDEYGNVKIVKTTELHKYSHIISA